MPLHVPGIGDLHLSDGQLQAVVDEAGAIHRLDYCHDRFGPLAQVRQAVGIGRPRVNTSINLTVLFTGEKLLHRRCPWHGAFRPLVTNR